ncbi:MAG: pantoate--beta-alanine ligase [Polyangiaceae bacterium]|nr:pantoate--beta-alanine ligase [Polyangiaceae bacterium]
MIEIHHEVAGFRARLDRARASGARVGLVPTMGALHDGHLSLVAEAKARARFVAATIFVNPTQFGPGEDLARYPRDLDRDVALLARVGCDAVLAPPVEQIYPPGERTRVSVGELGDTLCGPHRPGHFEGVATVVTKLFAIAGEHTAVFGRKDYQQLAIIRRLAIDLLLPVTVVGAPTVRDPDGLAMSSRNAYLSPEDRCRALSLSAGLRAAHALFVAGERRASALREAAAGPVRRAATSVDYVDVAEPDTLRVHDDDAVVGARALIAIAARVGATRLIDNVVAGEEGSP